MRARKIVLYTGNHDIIGIQDYIDFFTSRIKDNLLLSNKLSFDCDEIIIIEHFINIKQFLSIFLFLRRFKGKKILVVTEFIRQESKGKILFNSFENSFLKKAYNISSLLFFITLFFFFFIFSFVKTMWFFYNQSLRIVPAVYKIYNNFMYYLSKSTLKTKLMSEKLSLALRKANDSLSSHLWGKYKKIQKIIRKKHSEWNNFTTPEHYFFLFYIRFLTFRILRNYYDLFLLSHEFIDKNCNFLFDKKTKIIDWISDPKEIDLNKKNFVISFSGAPTPYRRLVLEKLNFNKNIFINLINNFDLKKSFIKSKFDKKNLVFSLHPKKTENWKYSSPTRYVNSLKKGEIPIILDEFYDNHSKLALTSDILNVESSELLNVRLKDYKKNILKIYEKSVKSPLI